MKCLILTGSPHTNGTTSYLADEFCNSAKEAGNTVVRFDTSRLNINPCNGCNHCRKNDGKCVYNDDMSQIYPHLMEVDAVVLVSPLYYFGMTAQLKKAIDRFYSINSVLKQSSKKLFLISAGSDKDDWAMDTMKAHYSTLCRYLNWEEGGIVLALGSSCRKDVENSKYQVMVRNLAKIL